MAPLKDDFQDSDPAAVDHAAHHNALAVGVNNLADVDNTSDANKPVSTAQAAALALKAPLASPTFTGTTSTSMLDVENQVDIGDNLNVVGAVFADGGLNSESNLTIGLSASVGGDLSVAGTSSLVDLDVSGSVTGIDRADVGLGSVDNTTDAGKPVSTAQAAAIAAVSVTDRARANHTGTQLAATISDFSAAADARIAARLPVFNVTAYGAVGNGITDDTAAVNAAISAAPPGAVLLFPPGTYAVDGVLAAIDKKLTVRGYGATIVQSNATAGVFAITASGVRVEGLAITGQGGGAAVAGEPKAISIVGASTAARLTDVAVVDCVISGWGFYGVFARWCDTSTVRGCHISDVWYAGVMLLSCTGVVVQDNTVEDIHATPNAYGIVATRYTGGVDLTSDPRSASIRISNNRVRNVTAWEGIDTHAGQRVTIVGNTVTGCKRGVVVVSDGTNPPNDCTVTGNVVDSSVTDGSAGPGIVVTGEIGNPATGCVVVGNTVRGHADQANSIDGAVYVHDTEALVVSGNTILEPGANGICLYINNKGFACTGNVVRDVWSDGGTQAVGIHSRSTGNTGSVSGNTLVRGSLTGKTFILTSAVRLTSATGTSVAVGPNYSDAATYLTDSVRAGHGRIVGAKTFAGSNSPETVVTAPAGSLYLNVNGGVGTTLYVKASGTGNTGWSSVVAGLSNVDNTSDANKPVSTAQQTALDLKAPLASPTFTGTVAGISKTMVGLGGVDNTADTAKPVSTAQQTALDLKAPLASPALTGVPTAPTAAPGTNTTQAATTAFTAAADVLVLAACAPVAAAVPVGGTTGQVLAKTSGTDYATAWTTPAAGGGGSGSFVSSAKWGSD